VNGLSPSELRSFAVDAARRHGLGGVAVALVADGKPPVFACLGLADRQSARSIDARTLFRIASISKTLTAISLMQLRDDGLLRLDDPVNNHLKQFRIAVPPGAPDVTFRHLLTHTSGIGEVPKTSDLFRRPAWGAGRPNAPPTNLGELYGDVLHVEVAPATKWAYANHGFAVLGQLVEDISGAPFAEHVRERVLRPIGMAEADYLRTDRMADAMATGYHWIGKRFRPVADYEMTLLAPGAVRSSLDDMVRYAAWLLVPEATRSDEVLATSTLHEMMSPQFSVDARLSSAMGLAFFLDRLGAHRVCGHDGNVPGFASALLVAPDDGVGTIALTNTSSFIGAHLLAAACLRAALGEPDPAREPLGSKVEPRLHLWPELVGAYAPLPGFLTNLRSWQLTGGEAEVFVRNRRLLVRALSPLPQLRRGVELHAIDDADPYLFAAEVEGLVVPVAFGADDSGRVEHMAIGAPAMATLHRRSPWRSSRRRLGAAAAAGGIAGALAAARVIRRGPA